MALDSFFSRGWTSFRSAREFFESSLHDYLRLIYGEILYTENPTFNFINVHKGQEGNLIFSEAVFADIFPEQEKIASVLPKALYDSRPLLRNETGGKSPMLLEISRRGWAITNCPLIAEDLPFFEAQNYSVEALPGEPSAAYYGSSEDPSINRIPSVRRALGIMPKVAAALAQGNPLLSQASLHPVNVLRYVQGDRQEPHSDAYVGTFCILLAYLTSLRRPRGRELVVGTFRFTEAYERILAGKADFKTISEDMPREWIEGSPTEIPPAHGKTVVLNNFNPRFFHEVRPARSRKPVYAISAHLGWRPIFSPRVFEW